MIKRHWHDCIPQKPEHRVSARSRHRLGVMDYSQADLFLRERRAKQDGAGAERLPLREGLLAG
jgi:hypothetical protein